MKQLINKNQLKTILGIGIFCVALMGCNEKVEQEPFLLEITDKEIFEAIFDVSEGRLQKIEGVENEFRFELYQDLFSETIKEAIAKRNTFELEESIIIPKEKAQAIFCLTDDNYCLVENEFTIPKGLYPLELVNPNTDRACDTFSWWYDVDGHSVNTNFKLCY